MNTARWLLPFTFGVDMRAIEYAVRLAESSGALLIPVSLLSASPRGARLEHIQQSKDFLEAVRYKAERFQVQVERYEVFTSDVQQSLRMLARDLRCDGIVLVTSNEHTCLLQGEEVKHLLVKPPVALVLLRLPPARGLTQTARLRRRFLSRVRRLWKRQNTKQRHEEAMPAEEEPLWVRIEQRHLG